MSFVEDAQRYPVTAIQVIGSAATFLAQISGRSVDHLALDPALASSEPWRFLTTTILHGGPIHLFFNVYWIWLLGRVIESRLGSLWMAALTVMCALVAGGLEVAIGNVAIGLSGVVYGYAFFAWARGRYDPRFAGIVDDRLIRFFVILFFVLFLLTESGVMNIANAAHFGGGLIGFALGSRIKWLAPAILAAVMAVIVANPVSTPSNSFGLRVAADSALKRGDPEKALGLYERALDEGVDDAGTRHNYAIALNDLGRTEDAARVRYEIVQNHPGYYDLDTATRIRQEYEARFPGGE